MLNRVFTTLLALLWFSVANHCVVADAFASPAKAAHHCGSKGSAAPAGPHDRCTKGVCCELFSPMTSGVQTVSPILTAFALPHLDVSVLDPNPSGTASLRPTSHPPAAGPPRTLLSLIGSLTLAQNAPPR